MPNALTHFHIYEKAIEKICKEKRGNSQLLSDFANRLQIGMGFADGGSDKPSLKSILQSLAKSWSNLGNALTQISKAKKTGYATLASYGYLGSNGPDMFFVPPTLLNRNLATNTLSTLMHHNTTGAPAIYGLILLKEQMSKELTKTDEMLWMCKLSYWLGHITHIAADITVHPFVNSRAGANKLLKKKFKNFRGGSPPKIWTLHNVVEQYQDRYVLENHYAGESSFRAMAFGSMAALHLRKKRDFRFIGETIDRFYGQNYGGRQNYEKAGCPYEYCRVWYWLDSKVRSHMSFRNYLKTVMPSKKQLGEDEAFLVGPDDFNDHIKAATALSVRMLEEALEFLTGETKAQGDTPREQVYSVRKCFPWLSMNFNIDAGLCFKFHECAETAGIGKEKAIACRVPIRVELKTDKSLDKDLPEWGYNPPPGGGARADAKTGNKSVVKQLYEYWGVDVVTDFRRSKKKDAYFSFHTVSRGVSDQETVGTIIRDSKKRSKPFTDVESLRVEYGDNDRFSVLSLVRGAGKGNWLIRRIKRIFRKYPEIKYLCDRMLVPTISSSNVWKRSGDGRFEKKKVNPSDERQPTELMFLKFHFFRQEDGGNVYEGWPGEIQWGPDRVPFEPGINNVAVVVDSRDKLKEVYLDQQKVWEAEQE
ncbi:MAG: zinc dependent phospholipase C family protein [Candidatus Zixiibacteriota bacterium]|nr:MAG: zinc dependent phospholipase C family protein [candidate division Zixibacteria bacterium]